MLRYGQQAEPLGNNLVKVTGICSVTGKPHSIIVSEAGLIQWQTGTLIQRALPDATPDEREFLMSGISPEGWILAFGTEEDE